MIRGAERPAIGRRSGGRVSGPPRGYNAAECAVAMLVALSVVGYPLAGSIGTLLGVSSLTASVPFRILVDLISAFLVGIIFVRRQGTRPNGPLVVLLVAYLARLVWDLQRPEFLSVSTDLLFYLATTLIPAAVAGIAAGYWRDVLVARAVFFIALAGGSLILIMKRVGFFALTQMLEATGRLSIEAVNPITIGHLGLSLVFAGVVLWFRGNPKLRPLLAAGVVLGGWLMIEANSRSPFLSLACASAAYLVATRRWRMFAGVVALGVGVFLGGGLLDRLQGSRLVNIEDRSSLTRVVFQRNAFGDFLEHPILGAGYLDSVTLAYPHNILIESAMALGLGGLVLVVFVLIFAGLRSIGAFRAGDIMLGLLFWQYAILAQVSGTLAGAGPLLILMMIMAGKYVRPLTALKATPLRSRQAVRRKPIAPRQFRPRRVP